MSEQIPLFGDAQVQAFPSPRPFQETAHRELRSGFTAGHRLQIVMAPTGAGKTFLALRVINEALAKGRRAVFICDRKTLINQTSVVADKYKMPTHGIIQADNPRTAPHRPFQIASAQTIQSRGIHDSFDVVVVDECHTLSKSTLEFISKTKAAVIGLSATPFTKGLGKIYSRVINAATMDELTKQGILTPMRVLSCVRPDMRGAKTSGGEWTAKAAEERGLGLVGDVVSEWLKHASGLKTIVFAPTILHCEELVKQFASVGVSAATFTADTPDSERDVLLTEYRKSDSKLRVLISVEALAKGFDVPDVGCVCDCRPLRKSLSTFIQMIGRGLRASPGKQECCLLDFSGNVIRFAEDFSDIYFNGLSDLDMGEKLDKTQREDNEEIKERACPACGYTPMGKRCVRCGFEPVRKSLIEHETGHAVEVDILKGAKKYAGSMRELYDAIATYQKDKSRRRELSGRGAGNPSGATAHAYKHITGKWPSFGFATVTETQPTATLVGKLRSMEIAYSHRIRSNR